MDCCRHITRPSLRHTIRYFVSCVRSSVVRVCPLFGSFGACGRTYLLVLSGYTNDIYFCFVSPLCCEAVRLGKYFATPFKHRMLPRTAVGGCAAFDTCWSDLDRSASPPVVVTVVTVNFEPNVDPHLPQIDLESDQKIRQGASAQKETGLDVVSASPFITV